MRSLSKLGLVALLLVAAALAVACGEDEEDLDVEEGEPVELGELRYNVQITRFLNPRDREDVAYLQGQPAAPPAQVYLAVFMVIENEGDSAATLPDEMTVRDTRDNTFEPARSESPFALTLGETVSAGEELPPPDSAAASGPIQGGMVLFLVDRTVTENRPIELEIPSDSGGDEARVELDI